jgi:hypothetical protein
VNLSLEFRVLVLGIGAVPSDSEDNGMDSFEITKTDQGFHIQGFPDAAKVVQLDGPKAKRLSDLALHRADLAFTRECLEGINLVPETPYVLREGLWRAAIVHFMKCFGSSESRFSLTAKQVYKGDAGAMVAFEYFKALRDMHLVHDANSYAQCLPGAILNMKESSHKVAKIVCTSFIGATLVQDNYGNLHRLVTCAQEWVVEQFDKLCDILTTELEVLPYDDLFSRAAVTYRVPTLDELYRKRDPAGSGPGTMAGSA